MTKLCETCPNRGEAAGEICDLKDDVVFFQGGQELDDGSFLFRQGPLSSLVDENGGKSLSVISGSDEKGRQRDLVTFKKQIDECEGPVTETVSDKRLFRRAKTYQSCGALGSVAVRYPSRPKSL